MNFGYGSLGLLLGILPALFELGNVRLLHSLDLQFELLDLIL